MENMNNTTIRESVGAGGTTNFYEGSQTASILGSNSKFLPQDLIFWGEMIVIIFLILFITLKYLRP